jgi:N-acetyl-alpha-D-glucosaminyl L-malate synthase BshA
LHEDLPIEVIPNFVDTDRFAPAEQRDRARLDELFTGNGKGAAGGPVLFHVSNFRPVKRTADLMDVLHRIRSLVPARLVLVGDGPDRALAAQRARDLGITDAVCFLGKQSDFVDYLKHADAFLLTSESESFGVAALEAMSAGVPVFAYRVGGLPEVVGEHTGSLVEPFDVEAVSRSVVEATANPARRTALGRGARAHVLAHFRREPALDRYETYFRQVLDSPARTGSRA